MQKKKKKKKSDLLIPQYPSVSVKDWPTGPRCGHQNLWTLESLI